MPKNNCSHKTEKSWRFFRAGVGQSPISTDAQIIVSPWSKVPRELTRIWQQISYVFVHPVELARFKFQSWLRPSLHRKHAGDQPMGSDVAVYLIFQPDGLSASTIQTCKHLSQNGYSVVLVSNGSVSETDRNRVIPHVGELIERPNFGYDFGGYQQGILQTLNSGRDVQNLLIMNDSVWFPIFDDSDLLDRMRDDPAQVTGPVIYHHRTPRRTHLQSYLMNFDRAVVESEAFRNFWESYSQTNYKVQTIRRGEMGLSAALRDAGFTLKAMFDQDQVVEAFCSLSSEELRNVYTYEAARNPIFRSKIRDVLATQADGSNWQERALDLLDKPGWRRYFLTNHPTINVSKVGFPILKKDRGFEYRLQRKMLLEIWHSGEIQSINPTVLEEIRLSD